MPSLYPGLSSWKKRIASEHSCAQGADYISQTNWTVILSRTSLHGFESITQSFYAHKSTLDCFYGQTEPISFFTFVLSAFYSHSKILTQSTGRLPCPVLSSNRSPDRFVILAQIIHHPVYSIGWGFTWWSYSYKFDMCMLEDQ